VPRAAIPGVARTDCCRQRLDGDFLRPIGGRCRRPGDHPSRSNTDYAAAVRAAGPRSRLVKLADNANDGWTDVLVCPGRQARDRQEMSVRLLLTISAVGLEPTRTAVAREEIVPAGRAEQSHGQGVRWDSVLARAARSFVVDEQLLSSWFQSTAKIVQEQETDISGLSRGCLPRQTERCPTHHFALSASFTRRTCARRSHGRGIVGVRRDRNDRPGERQRRDRA